MYIQKFHNFCNTSSADDGRKSGRKNSGNKQWWKIYQSIPAEYYKLNTAIWKDKQENMSTENVYYIQWKKEKKNIYIYILSSTNRLFRSIKTLQRG